MKDQNSRFYPCVAQARTCGGIAALTQHHYVCQRCGSMWDRNGDPVVRL
jgi:hypothetical protein